MVEKYFGIFRQKWKGNYSSIFRIGAICRGYYRKIFAIFFFIFPLLSFLHDLKNREMIGKYFTIFKHAQKWNKEQSFFHLLNWNNLEPALSARFGEMVEKYFIISRKKWNKRQSFFHFSNVSNWNNFRFGNWTKMVEKYFIIFRQKWNKRQSFFHLSNVSNWSNLEPAITKYSRFFFYFSSPLPSINRMENDRKVLDNFQAYAEMKRTIPTQEEDRHPDHAHPPSRERDHLDDSPFGWKGLFQLPLGSPGSRPRSIIRRSTEIV